MGEIEVIHATEDRPKRGRPRTKPVRKTNREVGELILNARPAQPSAGLLSNEDLEKRLSHRLDILHLYLDDAELLGKMAQSTLSQLGIYESNLIEHRQLLKGQPTAIVGRGEQKKLDEVAKLLLSEIKRRGLSVKLTERTAQVNLDPQTTTMAADKLPGPIPS